MSQQQHFGTNRVSRNVLPRQVWSHLSHYYFCCESAFTKTHQRKLSRLCYSLHSVKAFSFISFHSRVPLNSGAPTFNSSPNTFFLLISLVSTDGFPCKVFILYVKNIQPTSLYDVHKSQLAFARKFNSTSSRTGKRDFLKIKSDTNVNLEKQNATHIQFVSWLHYRKCHLFLRIKTNFW